MTDAFVNKLRASSDPGQFLEDNILEYLDSLEQPEEALQIIIYVLEQQTLFMSRSYSYQRSRGFFVAFDKIYERNRQFFHTLGFRKILRWSHGYGNSVTSRWRKALVEQLGLNSKIMSCRSNILAKTKNFRDRKTLKNTNWGRHRTIECKRKLYGLFRERACESIL